MKEEKVVVMTSAEFTAMNILFNILRDYFTEAVISDIYFKYCEELNRRHATKKETT